MARRHNTKIHEKHRKQIQTTQLLKRLHSIALGEIEADANSVACAKFLVNKVLPDARLPDELVRNQGQPVTVVFGPAPGADPEHAED